MKTEKIKKLEVKKPYLMSRCPFSLELEVLMMNKLIDCKMSGEEIASFIAAQRVHGCLKNNLTPYQVEVERAFWKEIDPTQVRVLFPFGEARETIENLRGNYRCGICGQWKPKNLRGKLCLSCRGYDQDIFLNI